MLSDDTLFVVLFDNFLCIFLSCLDYLGE